MLHLSNKAAAMQAKLRSDLEDEWAQRLEYSRVGSVSSSLDDNRIGQVMKRQQTQQKQQQVRCTTRSSITAPHLCDLIKSDVLRRVVVWAAVRAAPDP